MDKILLAAKLDPLSCIKNSSLQNVLIENTLKRYKSIRCERDGAINLSHYRKRHPSFSLRRFIIHFGRDWCTLRRCQMTGRAFEGGSNICLSNQTPKHVSEKFASRLGRNFGQKQVSSIMEKLENHFSTALRVETATARIFRGPHHSQIRRRRIRSDRSAPPSPGRLCIHNSAPT